MSHRMITKDEWGRFKRAYRAGAYPYQRLGQAFMNVFGSGEANPTIFYEEDERRVWRLVRDTYIHEEYDLNQYRDSLEN